MKATLSLSSTLLNKIIKILQTKKTEREEVERVRTKLGHVFSFPTKYIR